MRRKKKYICVCVCVYIYMEPRVENGAYPVLFLFRILLCCYTLHNCQLKFKEDEFLSWWILLFFTFFISLCRYLLHCFRLLAQYFVAFFPVPYDFSNKTRKRESKKKKWNASHTLNSPEVAHVFDFSKLRLSKFDAVIEW